MLGRRLHEGRGRGYGGFTRSGFVAGFNRCCGNFKAEGGEAAWKTLSLKHRGHALGGRFDRGIASLPATLVLVALLTAGCAEKSPLEFLKPKPGASKGASATKQASTGAPAIKPTAKRMPVKSETEKSSGAPKEAKPKKAKPLSAEQLATAPLSPSDRLGPGFWIQLAVHFKAEGGEAAWKTLSLKHRGHALGGRFDRGIASLPATLVLVALLTAGCAEKSPLEFLKPKPGASKGASATKQASTGAPAIKPTAKRMPVKSETEKSSGAPKEAKPKKAKPLSAEQLATAPLSPSDRLKRERLEPGVYIPAVIGKTVGAAGVLPRLPHADQIGGKAASEPVEMGHDITPQIR